MILADTTNAPLIGSWAIGAMFFLVAINTVLQIIRYSQVRAEKREITPQPLEVRGTVEYLPKKAFEEHREQNQREHENMFSKMGGIERGIRSEMKADLKPVSEKVDDMAREVSAHTATLELQNQMMAAMNNKLDRAIEARSK